MRADYERLLGLVEKPGRYVGGERGTSVKPPGTARLRFALAFPEVYEIAQSHLGLHLLYDILNRRDDVACERIYAPWVDMEQALRDHRLPLASLETWSPLSTFHIVGFSLQYELTYTNILAMLDLGGIALLASERGTRDPLVIAGGPCAFNPEPLAPFLDAVVLGDGEEAVLDIADAYLAWDRGDRRGLLDRLARIPGVYVPARFTPRHTSDGRLTGIVPADSERSIVHKRILADLNSVPLPSRQVVPSIGIVHDRVALEVMRGCVKGCRFCQAGYIYRPLRERDPKALLAHTERLLRDSGYDEVSLLSLSTGDYSCINPLLAQLMDRVAPQRVAVSLPSTRVDALDPHLLDEIRRVRKTGFTLAPEAGTQRLRDVIQKEYREEELVQAAELIFALGWRSLKLYFMIGLPTETEEDVLGIVDLARKVSAAGGHRRQVTASVSTFVPKPHTPFQWAPQLTVAETYARQSLLRQELRRHRIQFKWHDARLSYLEGVFARGDRRLADALLAAYRLGCRFDGWTERFRWDLWQRAFCDTGTDPDWYHRRRILDETLPWDHLDAGVSKKYLRRELAAAFARTLTPDCSIERCTYCGACDFTTVRNVTFHPRGAKGSESRGAVVDAWARDAMRDGAPWQTQNWVRLANAERARSPRTPPCAPTGEPPFPPQSRPRIGAGATPGDGPTDGEGNAEEWLTTGRQALEPVPAERLQRPVMRIRLSYQKLDRARFLGGLELTAAFLRASRRADLPLAFSGGHHPLPRLSFGPALSVGIASLAEFMELDLVESRSPDDVMASLNAELPEGLVVIEAEGMPLTAPSVASALRAFTYTVSLAGLPPGRLSGADVTRGVDAFIRTERFPLTKLVKNKPREIDARRLATIQQTNGRTLLVETQITRDGTVKPQQLVAAVLGLSERETRLLTVVKVATTIAEAETDTSPVPWLATERRTSLD